METVNAGDVPIGRVIDRLFSERGLESLVGQRGTACFVLARSALMPDFYRQLIQNVDTIDSTTRQHIAFIVFYGNRSSFVERPTDRPRLYEYNIQGLSSTADTWLNLEDDEEKKLSAENSLSFDRSQTNALRLDRRSRIASDTARATEIAASCLMERFGIFDAMLPCLLFVGSHRLDRPEIVRLDPEEPIKSLYLDVLAPLSDEFRRLEAYWKKWRELQWRKGDRQRALETIEKAKVDEPSLREKLEIAARRLSGDQAIGSELQKLEAEQAEIQVRCREYDAAETLDERVSLVQKSDPAYEEVQRLAERLANLEAERQKVYSDTATEDGKKHLEKITSSINRTRNKLGNAAAQRHNGARDTLDYINRRIYKVTASQREFDSAKYELRSLQDGLARAEQTLTNISEVQLSDADKQVSELYADLQSRSFNDDVLRSHNPSAVDIVATLVKSGRMGAAQINPARDAPLKILFLAANPVNTTSLDLEEELRSVEREIRGTRYRDAIVLSARHAVRPDDLVRYVREEKPDVVHFSGHGTSDGLVLRDDARGYHIVPAEALARFFTGRGVRLVVLNCCYSDEQAKAIAGVVDTVIGTSSALDDEAAKHFSVAFYRTLGDGHPIAEAFRDAGDTLPLHNLPDVYHLLGRSDWQIKFQSERRGAK